MAYVRSANPIWYEFTATGQIFDDTYWAFFQENTVPYNPQAVYHDNGGAIPWSNPIQFGANGGLPNDLYFDSTKTYRIQFRKGPLSSDPLIYQIDDYVPNGSGVTPDTSSLLTAGNLITNPQFADVNFNSPFVISSAGTYNVAPGWKLVLTGTGTCTVTKHAYAATATAIPGSPPYAIQVTTTGSWTTVQLIQTFDNNGGIFAGGAITFYMLAFSVGANENINVVYTPSSGGGSQTILAANVLAGTFLPYSGFVNLPASTNSATPPAASVDITIDLQSTGDIYITNVQVTGQSVPFTGTSAPTFQETTYERQVDHEFHYYKSQLEYKPIPSYLVGWDFPLNPCQELGSSVGTLSFGSSNKAQYVWDQTIIFQSTDATINFVRNTNTGGFSIVNTSGHSSRFAIMQYLPSPSTFDILRQKLCSQLKGFISTGTLKSTITLAWTAAASPFVPALPSCAVASIAADAIPTLDGTFVAVPNVNYSINAPFTLTTADTMFNFTGFDATAVDTHTATAFAFIISFDSLPDGSTVTIDYCSLNGGDIPTRPAPQSIDEVLRECQYYWEKSYGNDDLPAAVTNNNSSNALLGANTNIIFGIDRPFKCSKRVNPTMTWYSVGGAVNNIYNKSIPVDVAVTANLYYGKNTTGVPQTAAPVLDGSALQAHWVAESRLGKI